MARWISDCSSCCASIPPGGASEAQEHRLTSGVNVATNASANVGMVEPGSGSLSGSTLVAETEDRSRMRETNSTTERQWVAVTAYQPIDTVIKTVEVPVVHTREKYVPKLTVEEKIVEVPKYIPQIVEKVIEVPEVKYVDKIIEVPEYQYQYKCVPKIETRENIIERPRIDVKYIEKLVEVPQIKEVVRYHDVETVEEVIKYVPKGEYTFESSEVTCESSGTVEGESTSPTVAVPVSPPTVVSGTGGVSSSYSSTIYRPGSVSGGGFGGVNYPSRPVALSNQSLGFGKSPYLTMPPPYSSTTGLGMAGGYPPQHPPFGMSGSMPPSGPPMGGLIPGSPVSGYQIDQMSMTPSSSGQTARSSTAPFTPRVEHVYKPKVVKTVEFQKHLPISVDVPVPYMVPKPIVVPVQVPVLKFRDHFIPVPVRRRVVPRIRWTNEVYEVECVKEKPYMLVQDVIKPVPCDVEIRVHEFVEKAQPINPTELSQADVHAMWMRVNADLAEKRKDELGDRYPYVEHPPGTVFGEPGIHKEEELEEGGLQRPDPEVKGDGTKEEETPKAVPAAHEGDRMDPISLHPGHPLSMTYLQNQWIKKDTTSTHQMYTPEWFEAHQKALHGMTMQHPTQIQLSAEQAAALQPREQPFGQAPWFNMEVTTLPAASQPNEIEEQNSKCCETKTVQGEEQNADAASCCSGICR